MYIFYYINNSLLQLIGVLEFFLLFLEEEYFLVFLLKIRKKFFVQKKKFFSNGKNAQISNNAYIASCDELYFNKK